MSGTVIPIRHCDEGFTRVLKCDPRQMAQIESGHGGPMERRFSPYDFNGGTTLAISGKDFAVARNPAPYTRTFNDARARSRARAFP